MSSIATCMGWMGIVERHRLTPGSGVAVCISDNVNIMERQDLELLDESMESVFVEINKSQVQSLKDIIVGVIYRPPNKDIDIFNNHMKLLLEKLQKENKSCYILGDMNINIHNQETHTKTGQFVDIMFSNSILPVITRPTRVTATSAIDHIFTNDVDNLCHYVQGILVTDISDHYPVFHIIACQWWKKLNVHGQAYVQFQEQTRVPRSHCTCWMKWNIHSSRNSIGIWSFSQSSTHAIG